MIDDTIISASATHKNTAPKVNEHKEQFAHRHSYDKLPFDPSNSDDEEHSSLYQTKQQHLRHPLPQSYSNQTC